MPRRQTSVTPFEELEHRAYLAVVSISGPLSIQENKGPITLTASLSQAQRTPVEVRYIANGIAAAGSDYRLSIGKTPLSSSGVFKFAPGQTSVPITVTPIDDLAREGNESFTIQFISARGHTFGNRSLTAVIIDDDNYTAALVSPPQVTPGTRPSFMLQLSSPATKTETFYVSTRDGSAQRGEDYGPVTDIPVVFTRGQTSRSFPLTIRPNGAGEYDEFFYLSAKATSGGFPAISDLAVPIPGIGPDTRPAVSVNDVSINEGDAGTTNATFSVSLSAAYSLPVTVTYATADGSAMVSDTDYVATSGTVTFQPGETQKAISVLVIGDNKPEPNETFRLIISSPMNATIAKATGVATVVNDDGEPGFQITVNYNGNVDERVQTAVTQAVTKWQQVITGDVPSFVNPFNGQMVDDIVLDVRMGLLGAAFPTGTDGAAGTIANAGPMFGGAPGIDGEFAIRPGPRLPYWGTIGFDPANVAQDSAESLYTTALHEIAHALGFGGPLLFEPRAGYPNGLVVPLAGNLANPVYVGAGAVQAYNQIFQRNAANIAMESEGGAGTARVHWDDLAVPGELMNGFLAIGAALSRITVGAMQDLGYQVNPAAADTYRPTAASVAVGVGSPARPGGALSVAIVKSPAVPPQQIAAASIPTLVRTPQPVQQRSNTAVVAAPRPRPAATPTLSRESLFASLATG